jgi:release factor glutamine methyltransferase
LNIKKQLFSASIELSANSDNPRLDAEILLCNVLGKDRSYLFAWPEKDLTPQQSATFVQLIKQRKLGKPIAYLTSTREFWSMTFNVNNAVLIPRHDTEVLVEKALHLISNIKSPKILELGTGSGCIACAISSERPDACIIATDLSKAALEVCNNNVSKFALNNIAVVQGSWFQAIDANEKYNLIISNPPYIEENDKHLYQGDLPSEPETALHSGPDGLNAIRSIIQSAPKHLKPNGWLALEHGYNQSHTIQQMMKQSGFLQLFTDNDLSNTPRITGGCLHAS